MMVAHFLVIAAVAILAIGEYRMSVALDRLQASMTANSSAVASVLALVSTIAGEIRNNVDDSDALNAIADKLDAESAQIAAAVTANTPAAGDASQTPGGDAPTPTPVTNSDGSVSTGQAQPGDVPPDEETATASESSVPPTTE